MPTQTLLQRAMAFAAGPAAALAAIVPLAAAPAANATILAESSEPGEVFASFMLGAPDTSLEYFGSPLVVVPGTNASNQVRLSAFGELSVFRPFSGAGQPIQTQLSYITSGAIQARAGDVFAVAYSFSLDPDVSIFGLPTDIAWSITAFVLDGSPGVARAGSATGVTSDETLDFVGSFDVASFATDTTAFFDLLFEIAWSIPAAPNGTDTTFGSLIVDVPANSIDLLLVAEAPPAEVPEPAMPALMIAGLAGLLAANRRRLPVRA